jgi:hypothetical protein
MARLTPSESAVEKLNNMLRRRRGPLPSCHDGSSDQGRPKGREPCPIDLDRSSFGVEAKQHRRGRPSAPVSMQAHALLFEECSDFVHQLVLDNLLHTRIIGRPACTHEREVIVDLLLQACCSRERGLQLRQLTSV